MKGYAVFVAPFGPLFLTIENGSVTKITFTQPNLPSITRLEDRTIPDLLDIYFEQHKQPNFTPSRLSVTPFIGNVLQQLQTLKFGSTATYGEVAAQLGNPKASRAVGLACNKNPFPILIPCHRVIGKTGSLTGYAGGVSIKRWLLEFENES